MSTATNNKTRSEVTVPPMDEFNTDLVSQVHPPEWKNPTPEGRYNLVVIGAGTAGLVTAAGAAGLGAKVAIIEKNLLGGDCLNVGCVPSKCLIAAARTAADIRRAGDYGIEVPDGVRVDFPKVMERMRRLRAHISHHDSAQRFTGLGVDVYLGAARFLDGSSLEVDGAKLSFKKAVIATGARASAPPIPGIDDIPYLTNENLFNLTELPKRLGIIGAGPIGCEMAQAFARFGSEVHLVEAMHGILPNEDPEASEIVREAIAEDGVKLLCCGKELRLSKAKGGGVRLRVDSHGNSYDETVDQLLVSVGRAPNVEGLDLEKAGVEFKKFGVKVNDQLQTSNPRIFAAGDICMKYKFTHAADFAARTVLQNALFMGRKRLSALTIPWCTYTDPEIAHVGLYEKDAEEQGIEIDTYTKPMAELDRAIAEGRTEGFVRIHTRKGGGEILGATAVASHAGEMISEITTAMQAGMGLGALANVIHPYPTEAEAIRHTGDLYNRTRLTPTVKNIFAKWLEWTR